MLQVVILNTINYVVIGQQVLSAEYAVIAGRPRLFMEINHSKRETRFLVVSKTVFL